MGKGQPLILVIEDNPPDVQLLCLAMEEAGLLCELKVVNDGGEAVALMKSYGTNGSRIPDLAIVDLNLPKNDGVEVMQAMRGNPALVGVPVLVLSSSPSPRDIAKISAFSRTRYMTKPSFLDRYLEIGQILQSMLAEAAGESG